MTQAVTALGPGGILNSPQRASPFSLIGPEGQLPSRDRTFTPSHLWVPTSVLFTLHHAVAVVTLYKIFSTVWGERWRTIFIFKVKVWGSDIFQSPNLYK